MLHQDYQQFGSKNYQDTWSIGTHYTEDAIFCWLISKGMSHFSYIALYVAQ